MTFPASSLAIVTHVGNYRGVLVANLDLETHKVALFTNAVAAPNLITDTAYGVAPWNANEIPNGAGYATGGIVVVNTVFAHISVGNCGWDFDDPSWPTSTIVNARGAMYYMAALANQIIGVQTFSADFSSGGGTFLIQEPANGPFQIDMGG